MPDYTLHTLASHAWSAAASSKRVDKTLRSVHAAAKGCGAEIFACAAWGRVSYLAAQIRKNSYSRGGFDGPFGSLAAPKTPAQMLEGYLALRGKPARARKALHASAPSALSADVLFMAFLNRAPAELIPAVLDHALMSMAQANDPLSVKTLLLLGADPNARATDESRCFLGAPLPLRLAQPTHPLSAIAIQMEGPYYESAGLLTAALYLGMGASPDGVLSGAKSRSIRTVGVKKRAPSPSPMAACFKGGSEKLARALFQAGAANPCEPDESGEPPVRLLSKVKDERQRELLTAFAAEMERLTLEQAAREPAAASKRAGPRL